MADPITISGGINTGTESNDELNTVEWQRNVEKQRDETTLYEEGAEGLGGDDALNNNGGYSNVRLDGGTGNDKIINTVGGGNVSFLGGDGNDYIENGTYDNRLNNALIDGGANNDIIENYGDNASISAGNGNDSIYSVGKKATISGGNDNDSISNHGDDSAIDGGNGNDYLSVYGSNITARGGAGNDTLNGGGDNEQNRASNVLFDDADGNNSFRVSYVTNSTINAAGGTDSVSSSRNQKLLINVGAGNNSVTSEYDSEITIQAQGGNDTIQINDGNKISIDAGNGANVIDISNVNDSTSAGFTINAGTGADSITNGGDNAIINAGNGNNSIVNGGYRNGNNVTITSGSGNDFINNYYSTEYAKTARQENVIINAGAGNDTVTNSGNKTTIDGGAGNDELSSYDSTNVSINGGAGSDTIFIANGIVSGGAGDDSLNVGDKVLIQYNAGDGNDLIWSFDENSTLSISGGNYSSVTSGDDLILSVGDGKITLQGAATLSNAHIIGTSSGGSTDTNTDTTSGKILFGGKYADYISSEISDGDTVQGIGGNDTIISNSKNVLLDGGRGNDLIQNNERDNVTMSGGAGDDLLNNYLGEKVSMSGGNGSDTLYTNAASGTINGGAGSDRINLTSTAQKTLIEYKSGDGNDFITGFDGDDTLSITGANYGSFESGNDLIITVGNREITLAGAATLATVNVIGTFEDELIDKGIFLFNTDDDTSINGTAHDDFVVNIGARVTIRGLAGDDYLANNLDSSVTAASAVANFLDAGTGNDTIYNYHSYQPTLIGGDGNDSIVVSRGHMTYIDASNGNDTIVGKTSDAREVSDWSMGGYATILGGDGNDYINPFYSNNSTIDGGAGNDTINMMGADSTITGGTGDDKISLGTADSVNVRINYNSGDGNDLIQGFNENSTLNITGGKYSSVKNVNDVILSVGNGKITLKGATTLETINIIGNYDTAEDSIISNSENRSLVTGTSANDTITNTGMAVTVQALAGNDLITNSGKNAFIYGDEGNDIINSNAANVFIYGDTGNDSIFAGGSNTTINGGEGSNYVSVEGSQGLFVVLEGKTTVDGFNTGFGSGSDSVYITGDPAVDFKSGGLTFYEEDNGNSLTLNNVTDTEKVYLYYAATNRTAKEIFIAKNDMYTVTESDFSLKSNEDLYFVGTSATNNHGIDFSNISQALNVTLNTDYSATPSFWVNNVYSIVGGAGLTTITGSEKSDTIIAGTGNTKIDAGSGDDHIGLTTAEALVKYENGDGNDLITGFNANSTLSITGEVYSSVVSGEDVILTVGEGKLTLQGAANLENPNISGSTENANVYSGGYKTISDYDGQAIVINSDYLDSIFEGDNFIVYSSTGALTIENVTNKVIDLRDSSGNAFIKAYTPSQAGVIDGRGLDGYEIIQGADDGMDVIFASDSGSKLWGGNDTVSDAIAGGNGADTFICGRNQGSDNFYNVSSADAINLVDVSLSDIVGTFEADGTIAILFNTGNAITAQSTDTLSAAINLADGSSWRFNHTTKFWQNA